MSMTVGIIIPALNEEESIGQVVARVPDHLVDEVLVVDNGSTDRTAEFALSAGARVVREERRGYGYACAAGVAAAADRFDVLVFMDGDGSDDPSEVAALIEPIARDRADLVLGTRVLSERTGNGLLPQQRLGNALTTSLVRLLYRQHITDLPPYKAIRRTTLAGLGMSEMTYGWTVEMIVKCAKRHCHIEEVPVTVHPRTGGRSKVSGTLRGTVLAAYYLLRTTIKHVWSA